MAIATQPTLLWFSDIRADMVSLVGGKNASLGDMVHGLVASGVRVPDGFALTVEAYLSHLRAAGLESGIRDDLRNLDVRDVPTLSRTARAIRDRIAAPRLPKDVAEELRAAYASLSWRYGEEETDVAVRSSATAEDLPSASFAGQQESFLNVRGFDELERAVRACMASLFTDRAIVYRAENAIPLAGLAISVGVQKMVRSDLASAGVMFTLDTETGFQGVILVTGSWGLGEMVVKGRVNPDEFWVHKAALEAGHRPVLRRELGDKARKLVYGEDRGKPVQEVRVAIEDRQRLVLTDDEVLELARFGLAIERHASTASGHPTPMDVEWAKDGRSGEIFIVQARPETVHGLARTPRIESYTMRGRGKVLARGKSVGNRIGSGPVRIVRSVQDLEFFREGEVLVAPMTDPDWEPALAKAAAVVTDTGGRTCHAAIVSRELGLTCVVGTGDASHVLRDGQTVTVSCAEGEEGRVYEGALPFDRQEIALDSVPTPRVPLMLNLADPDRAFRFASLPSAGVGLLRIEFLVANWIGIHPMALVHPDRVTSEKDRVEIARRTARWTSGEEFFVDRMATGVGLIAGGFHPRPVIVRFSDFKTNEYAGLLGGEAFEPVEANPMIGFRGASRYYDERYREGFALECRAVRRIRESMGLENLKVMIPFCRSLDEGRKVLEELRRNGLVRGEHGLEVWMMCEVPSNVVLAKEFCELFDGFSIGSNDLTQLTLGVDRDSTVLAHLFDERDPAVRRSIAAVIETAHREGRKVGICGQAPSDYPEFAEWLASIGIDSMSLNPDSLVPLIRRLAGPA